MTITHEQKERKGEKLRKIKTTIRNILLEICENVYFDKAPDDVEGMYIVYRLYAPYNNQGIEVYTLDVDVLDRNQSSKNIDETVKKVKQTLDRIKYIDEELQFTLMYERTLFLNEDSHKRQTVIFICRMIERS